MVGVCVSSHRKLIGHIGSGVLIWRYDAGWGIIRVYEGAKSNILGATHPDCSLVHALLLSRQIKKPRHVHAADKVL